MKLSTPLSVLTFGLVVNAETLQERDLGSFQAYLKNANADLVAVDNAITGVAAQLNNTQLLFREGVVWSDKQANLTETEAYALISDYTALKPLIFNTMDHFKKRQDVIAKSPECQDVSKGLFELFYTGSLFFSSIAGKTPATLYPFFKDQASDITNRLVAEVKSFKCQS